jgi:hypothetical protein
VELLKGLTAKEVVAKLDKTYATFGIPKVLKTDNGPPFTSKQFADFAQYCGFYHKRVTPLWPRANGEV